MKSKFDTIINKVLNESAEHFSIGNELDYLNAKLYNLYTNLDPKVKTKSGALVSEVLKNILDRYVDLLDEYVQIINRAKQNADQPEAIKLLLRQLSLD